MSEPSKPTRRAFLSSIAVGAGALAITGCQAQALKGKPSDSKLSAIAGQAAKDRGPQKRNMCGFKAQPIKTVRIGLVGLGGRGGGAMKRLSKVPGAKIVAVCDLLPDRVERARKRLAGMGVKDVAGYSGDDFAWKKLCDRDDIDLVYSCTPWRWHTPVSVYAMKHGKHAATEVPAAVTIDECWELVTTSEETGKHCMQLENCCYDFFEMMTLNMARKGFLGDLVHAEGAYIHDLRNLLTNKNGYQGMWRLKHNLKRDGNLYPTHGLGPIAQCMNINRSDKFDYLTSVSSDDFQLGDLVVRKFGKNSELGRQAGNARGNMNTTMIKTSMGRSIMVQHDVTTPRAYSRIHLVSGTKATVCKWPVQKIMAGHKTFAGAQLKKITEEYAHPLCKRIGEMARKVGGHGGMDFIMDYRLIQCLREGVALDQDVYDAAAWSAIGPLSEWSVANRSNSIDVPDFTRSKWKTNKPLGIVS
ncbi:MAG: Gfo/Idh/MocA family oxidoreductase [bacterium]|nr:Gfo/Idh/MocA family oxidoreductase [bacterium]